MFGVEEFVLRRPLQRNAFEYRWAANGTASEGQRTPDGVPANPSDFRPRSPPLLVAYNYDRVSITLHAHPLAFAGATAQQQTRTEERRLQMDFGLSKKLEDAGARNALGAARNHEVRCAFDRIKRLLRTPLARLPATNSAKR